MPGSNGRPFSALSNEACREMGDPMRSAVISVVASLLSAGAGANAHELTTPPGVPHPLPQGAPYAVVGATPHRVIQLRYGIINGERVLFDPATTKVVYILQP